MDRSRATDHVQKRTLHQSNRLDAVYTNMQEKVRFIAYFSRKKLKTKFEPAGMVRSGPDESRRRRRHGSRCRASRRTSGRTSKGSKGSKGYEIQ